MLNLVPKPYRSYKRETDGIEPAIIAWCSILASAPFWITLMRSGLTEWGWAWLAILSALGIAGEANERWNRGKLIRSEWDGINPPS